MEGNNEEDEINKLLLKIEQLEEKNRNLRKSIEEKEKQIKTDTASKNKNYKKEIKESSDYKTITLEEDRKAAKRFENELKFLNINSLQITENLVEKKITFKPNKQYGAIYILGDFNGWEHDLMQKNEKGFSYKVVLIKGFKFYYSLQTTEETIIDYNNPYEENKNNSQLQNYINLYQNENEETSNFDFKNDLNILKTAQRNFLLLKINDEIDNTIFLEKFQRHIINSQNNSNMKKNENLTNEIKSYYDDYLNKVNYFEKKKLDKFKLYFNNRILLQNSPIMKGVQYQYKILSISEDNNSFICMRLYDHNQIKLNSEYYTNKDFCWKIPLFEIVSTPISKRDKLYHLLSLKESQKISDEYNNDIENIIIAYFDDLEELNKNNRFKKYRKTTNVSELVKPKRVEPNDVDMNDYEYYYLNNQIINIKNKDDNSYIEFKIVEENKKSRQNNEQIKIEENKIKEIKKDINTNKKEEKKQNDNIEIKPKKEIIKNKEKKPAQYLVYYTFSETNKVVILHCHILDKTFKYKKIKIKEIKDNEDPHILKRDKLYINSSELLLINKSSGPIKLYFKGKKVQMETKLIDINKLYRLKSVKHYESTFHDVVISIIPIKEPIKLNNELLEKCQETLYNGKEILNGIDTKIEYNESFGDDTKLAVHPCLLVELTQEEEIALKNKPKKEVKKEKKSYELQKLDLIEKEMNKYRKYTKDIIKKMKRSEKEDIAITLDDYKSTMDMICNYVQEKEMWDLLEKVSLITNEIEDLLNIIDNN